MKELSEKGTELQLQLKPYEEDENLLSLMPIYPDADSNYVEKMEEMDSDDSQTYHAQVKPHLEEGGVRQYIVGIIGSEKVPQAIYFEIDLGIYPEDGGLSQDTLDKASDELLDLLNTIEFTTESVE